ncbi:1-deoxy-D-xylulose-5-phosphate reductoisomerase [Acidimicrobiaceae bacterium USS-CC1]|uniref:1-deoxy-D-xylulose 5-phosphate reductoisomerase n=1 Tax=Acidiferrimicrobium australe TaxID=2664430 RepID=A0ABW9QQS2_9ACTN|nr:1-deoxy-D-xylulose-5-phosphate reductoisomerase [Acidiferrimicrobium australe]
MPSPQAEPTTVSLVGSTGSIGTQAVDVITAEPGRYRVVALAASRSVERLAEQARRLRPDRVAIAEVDRAAELRAAVPAGTEVLAGEGALEAVSVDAQVVVNGVVGFAGLPVTLAALRAGRRLALANKESLIAGGPVVQAARATPGAEIVPVDSEHCAVHQCLRAILGERGMEALPHLPASPLRRVVLTASGGPFRGRRRQELAEVTVADALAHPTWSMGPKITVDSSTLMNKGLEVIEAHELFGVGYDDIDVVVHPQSIVHSMIETTDGATLAQLSMPDMRLPIGYALAYPDRIATAFGAIDWSGLSRLEFEAPDREAFPCLDLAYRAGRAGGSAPACLNGANEVAVDAFLGGRIRWVDIPDVIAAALDDYSPTEPTTVADVLDADRSGRDLALTAVARRVSAGR